MAYTDSLTRRAFGETMRRDKWWLQPMLTGAGLLTFVIYSTWAAFQNAHYTYGPYLSPFYSPLLWGEGHHAWFGARPPWWPDWLFFSPAILILWAPAGFRFTCYYYRGAYYKALWGDPPNCTVGEPRKGYWGENSFPLILQNLHRYFMYIAVLFLFILTYDVLAATQFENPDGTHSFGIGVGTLLLAVNVYLLSAYTLGCHSLRHLIGGYLDRFSGRPARMACYNCVTCLNVRHQRFAWLSLFTVGFSDLYVRLCSMGIISDLRIL
jgi:hypothetical protein